MKTKIHMVVAGTNASGIPDFCEVVLDVTAEMIACGDHYDMAVRAAEAQRFGGALVAYELGEFQRALSYVSMGAMGTINLTEGWKVNARVDDDKHLNVYVTNKDGSDLHDVETGQGDGINGEQLAYRVTTSTIAAMPATRIDAVTVTLVSADGRAVVLNYDRDLKEIRTCPAGEPDEHTTSATFVAGPHTIQVTGDMWRDLETGDEVDKLLNILMQGNEEQIAYVKSHLESDIKPCLCGTDHTLPETVRREYIDKDGDYDDLTDDDDSPSVFGLGHYTKGGDFEPDESVSLDGRFDLSDNSDSCAICYGQL